MANIHFAKIEKKWQKRWEDEKAFEVSEKSKKPKYYVLDMFPYPSGTGLHMGHAFVFTLGDIFARFKRLQGYNVLYPIGYDSLGLPAENAAIKVGTHPKEYTANSMKNFMKQQKAMGWSYDWSRLVKTHDPEFYKWDQWIFLKMLEKGIAYRKKAPVNWCDKCLSVLANEQVVNGCCWRHEDSEVKIKHLEQWFFKITNYADELLEGLDKLDWPDRAKKMQRNWIGKSYGTEIVFKIDGKSWPIFTTRPDTLMGVTFMVVSAQHSKLMEIVTTKQKKEVESFLKKIKTTSEKDSDKLNKEGVFSGSYAEHPLTGEKVPIYVGNFVLADYGSGMVMAVPAHDQRDFEFAQKYKLPVVQVIRRENVSVKSYLMGASKINDEDLTKLNIEIIEKTEDGDRKIIIPKDKLNDYEKLIINKLDNGFWNEYLSDEIIFLFKHKNGKVERIILDKKSEEKIDKLASEFIGKKWTKSCVWKWLAENNFYTDLIIHEDFGKLINSGKFNGLESKEAKEEISKILQAKKLGKKTVNYKLRDWLISRQRYWGTPIPIIYCDKCGAVPVPEKDLPVKLPEKVKFGKGNPLETANSWKETKCPKCSGKGRRETDTMDTFVNSSWYYLRYTDPKNSKEIFDKKKANYWTPIDQYIGGPEHITMHLIYIRFYAKFLRDLGLLKFDEPALKYFTQGIVKASDGEKMSKSRGNVVEPLETIEKYGADTLRLALVSFGLPDADFNWNEKILLGSNKFLNKVYDYFSDFKSGKKDVKIDNKMNKSIELITKDIENFKHNLAVIKIRQLFDSFQNVKIDKNNAESFLKLLHVYCPYITEELYEKLGNKKLISLSEWPKVGKIDEGLLKAEESLEKTIEDINYVINLIKEKENKDVSKIFIYVMPNEVENFDSASLTKRFNKEVKVFAVNDSKKYDPEGKAKKAKPGRAGIYLE